MSGEPRCAVRYGVRRSLYVSPVADGSLEAELEHAAAALIVFGRYPDGPLAVWCCGVDATDLFQVPDAVVLPADGLRGRRVRLVEVDDVAALVLVPNDLRDL